jgi:hypothetical protein
MGKAVLFDLFEALMTEIRDPAGYPPVCGVPGELLGLGHDTFRRAWAEQKDRRMTSELSYIEAVTELRRDAGVEPPVQVIRSRHEHRGGVDAHRAGRPTWPLVGAPR